MKTRTPTKDEKEFMDKMARVGCIACIKDGRYNDHVSLHHMDGRTKPGCHYHVIPLCGKHHQIMDTQHPPRWYSIHGNKKQFEELYGTEEDLYQECLERMKRPKFQDVI